MKISNRHSGLTILFLLLTLLCFSQKKYAFVSGKVVDDNENPLTKVSVVILGQSNGITTNDSGYFRIRVEADKAFALIFSYAGRRAEQKNFLLSEGEEAVSYTHLYYWIAKCQQAMGQTAEAKLNYQRAFGLDQSFTAARDSANKLK